MGHVSNKTAARVSGRKRLAWPMILQALAAKASMKMPLDGHVTVYQGFQWPMERQISDKRHGKKT